MIRHCPVCGGKLATETSRGGIPRRVCEDGPHGISDAAATDAAGEPVNDGGERA